MEPKHKSLDRALDIYELVSQKEDGIRLEDICKELNIPKSSGFTLIHTLTDRKYLSCNKNSQKYTLGIKSFEIGNKYLNTKNIHEEIRKIVEDISRNCNETTHFAILDITDVVYLFKFESTKSIRMVSEIGKRLPAHATAIGKALLSKYDTSELLSIYQDKELISLTDKTITDINILSSQIENVKKENFAYEIEESTDNVKCIARPIIVFGNVIAAISLAIPVLNQDIDLNQYQETLEDGGKKIEILLKSHGITSL